MTQPEQATRETASPNFPSGAIILWGSSVIPDGWALCDGTQSSHSSVFVPDLRDKFIVGSNQKNVNTSGSADKHSHKFSISNRFTTNSAGTHSHGFPSTWYDRDFDDGDYSGIDTKGGDVDKEKTRDAGSHSHTVDVEFSNAGTTSDAANRPSWYALCFIIKL